VFTLPAPVPPAIPRVIKGFVIILAAALVIEVMKFAFSRCLIGILDVTRLRSEFHCRRRSSRFQFLSRSGFVSHPVKIDGLME
jgi:hypothetical protein